VDAIIFFDTGISSDVLVLALIETCITRYGVVINFMNCEYLAIVVRMMTGRRVIYLRVTIVRLLFFIILTLF